MLYLASLDTINFRFQALGATEQEALGILALAWEEHARQSGAYVTWDDLADDANVTALQLGHGYRGGSDIVEADTTSSASRQTFIDTGAYLPTGAAGTDETFDVEIRDEAREGEPARHVVHIHAAHPGPYLALSTVESRRLVAALTDALEEHDATRELELSIARLEARQRIGAGE